MKHLYLLAACWLFLPQVRAQSYAYSTRGVTVAGGNGAGPAANQLNNPNGIVVDAAGNLYVAEYLNHRIQKWAPGAATGVTIAGGSGAGPAASQLDHPTDLRFDAAGNMYVADALNQRVQKFAPGSTTGVTVAGGNGRGSAANQFNIPTAIALDAAGNIYVVDYFNHRIQKWAPGAASGTTVVGAAGPGSGADQLSYPDDIFIDAAGNLYVADSYNNRIQKYAPGSSNGVTVAGGHGYGTDASQFNRAVAVRLDAAGNIFVADYYNNRIQKWAPGAAAGITVAGGNGTGSAPDQFFNPINLAFDAGGNLYVSDESGHRVQKFTVLRPCPEDIVITAASCSGKTTITWPEPRDSFPEIIDIPAYLDPALGKLNYLGALNGHGYYRSVNAYSWSNARAVSEYIGDTGVNGHLVTITSAAENTFIANLLAGRSLYPWIGLYNTGKPGSFRWVTEESFVYTNWAPGEPSNFTGNPANVAEPHVHLYPSGQWNDQRRINLPFILEFDRPVIQYRQVSGVARGSEQSPGAYMICYERTNRTNGTKDSCCFSVTIRCQAVTAESIPAKTGSTSLVQPPAGSSSRDGALRKRKNPSGSPAFLRAHTTRLSSN